MEIGTLIHLQGITLRGKNRINRGGIAWMVRRIDSEWGLFVESIQKGQKECFWMRENNDPHVKRINGQ